MRRSMRSGSAPGSSAAAARRSRPSLRWLAQGLKSLEQPVKLWLKSQRLFR
jgi:hypothetical protein